jgi:MYXO-CTERM domain-containing protein
MKRSIVWLALGTGVAVSSSAFGQFTISPGGLNGADGRYGNGAIPTSLTGTGQAGGVFRNEGSTSTDHLFANAWWWRGPGDTREYTFGNAAVAGGPTSAGAIVGNNLGTLDTGGYDYTVTNATAGYSFTAALRWTITNPSGSMALVAYSAAITNTGASAIDMSLFAYTDYDVGDSTTNVYSFSGDTFTITRPTGGGPTATFQGTGSFAHQAGPFGGVPRSLLTDADVDNLDNTVTGSPGDYTGAFQWNINVAAGGTVMVGGLMTAPAPGALALLGLGGLVAARRRRS